jgi:hypothetical protein
MSFVFIYENRIMKPIEIVLRSRGGRIMEEMNSPHTQLLHADKKVLILF